MSFNSIKDFVLKVDKNSRILANINQDVLSKLPSDIDVSKMEDVISNSMKCNYEDLNNLDSF